ncbi:hypothetical protein KR018_007709, partial [Drosophila ironensis]
AGKMEDWSDWNPMDVDFHNKDLNRYDNVHSKTIENANNHVPLPPEMKEKNYPYMVIANERTNLQVRMINNFFTNKLVAYIEPKSRSYMVYFHSVGCLEKARELIDKYPFLFTVRKLPPVGFDDNKVSKDNDKHLVPRTEPLPDEPITSPTKINLQGRIQPVSDGDESHPEFIVPPLLTNMDYAKGSLLERNDPNRRFLNAKDEYALERHGAYELKDEKQLKDGILLFSAGRTTAVPKYIPKDAIKSISTPPEGSNLARCVACQNWTNIVCKRCQTRICNAECMESVADEHKKICATGKPFINDKYVRKFPQPRMPASGEMVRITAFQQTNVAYVILADRHMHMAYLRVVDKVRSMGAKASKLQDAPKFGQFVILQKGTHILRAMVLNPEDLQKIYVVCLDYGSVEVAPLENLLECNETLAGLPCYPIAVQLRGIAKHYMSPNIRALIYELVRDFVFRIKYSIRHFNHRKGIHVVTLIEGLRHRSVNRLFKSLLTPVEPSLAHIGYKENELPHLFLPTGKNIEVVIMDNSFLEVGLLYCTIKDFAYEICRFQQDIQHYGNKIAKQETYSAPKDELCIAKYHGKWCRGVSMELVGDGFPSIFFLDYGNIVPTSIRDIRAYPREFAFPVMTTELKLIDFPEKVTEEQLKNLKEYFALGRFLTCDEIIKHPKLQNFSGRFKILETIFNSN